MRLRTTPSRLSLREFARNHERFYGTLPASDGDAGQLVSAEPMRVKILPGIPLRARAWRVLYRSTTATGAPTVVSGAILVPRKPYRGDRPLIGYALGTQGLAPRCAPSLQMAAGLEYETPIIAMMLRRGWAVAFTDYPGLGVTGGHTYVVGRALGPAVLDAMRAARALPDAGLPAHGPAAVFGYSEGGAAAGWAAQLQPSYAPDVPLVAAAIGGAPADLEYSMDFLAGGRFAWLHAYGAAGLDVAYPELQLDRYLNDRGRRMREHLTDSHIIPQILRRLPYKFERARYLVEDPLTAPDWLVRVRENRLGAIAPAAPVLLTHGTRDQACGYQQAPRLRDDWTRLGVDVTFRRYRGLEHLTAAAAHLCSALPWLAGHFAGHNTKTEHPTPMRNRESA